MLRYLPKYSPDLNPIEQAFSKLKAHVRNAAERTIPRLCRGIGTLAAHSVIKNAPITSGMQAIQKRVTYVG